MSEPLAAMVLPAGLVLERTTPAFTATTVPAGLLRAHRVGPGVWGTLVVESGTVVFVMEATGARRPVGAGERQVIPPEAEHHVEPSADAVFSVEFHRPSA
ncbi:DUF1971 domain-containing protein [Rhabdothermincola salaria]|uniref:DUF1971 domain-containing protein n=1 Tax=Rhabdothermincola salaria TaxID=2903142 RepID=UPI001E479F39|nr:DUF1971 domain-containing protein [Rhabdothermincola salaria]MCD9622290.1 DUF1971 domain-containing protein [Rhabdothermincola salaria]